MTEQTNSKKPYLCIDCGTPVARRVKRCAPCNTANLRKRPTYKRTPEANAKMSAALKGKPKPTLRGQKRPEVAKKIAAAWTPEMRAAAIARGNSNAQSKEWLERIASALTGEKNPNWQGGIAKSKYAPGFCKSLKAKIRQRDGYTCQLCGMTEDELGYRLSIHHSDYDKTNHDESNLFATCKRCNSLVNTNRDVWLGYFYAIAVSRQLSQNVNNLVSRKVITQRKGFISTVHGDGPDLSRLFAGLIPDEP